MNAFQTTVLGVAVVILILILTVFGVLLARNKKNLIYPPNTLPCPNYWQRNNDGTCMIPIAQPVLPNDDPQPHNKAINIGSWDRSTYNGKLIPGLDASRLNVDFNNSAWGANKDSATGAIS